MNRFPSAARLRLFLLVTVTLLLTVPVSAAQELSSSLDVGGQIRERSQLDAKDVSPNASTVDFHELRTRLHLGFAPTERVEAFVQLQDSRRFGNGSGTLSPPTGTIDLHQAYFRVDALFGTPLSLKLGRQELAYGNQRLVGSVGWHPRGRTFDGGVLAYEGEAASVDLFAARLAPGFSGTAVAEAGSNNLLGLYSTWALGDSQTLEAFALLDNNTREVADETALTRFTPGLALRGTRSAISYTLEGAYQTGTQAGVSIGASLLSATVGYAFGAGSPSMDVGYTRLSGDPNGISDGERGTFNTLFATNHKFYGYMDYFLSIPADAPAGLQDFHLKTSVSLSETVDASAHLHHFQETDAPSGRSTEAYGQEIDLTLSYQFADPMSVTVGASSFLPDNALAPDGDTAYWAYVMTTVNL